MKGVGCIYQRTFVDTILMSQAGIRQTVAADRFHEEPFEFRELRDLGVDVVEGLLCDFSRIGSIPSIEVTFDRHRSRQQQQVVTVRIAQQGSQGAVFLGDGPG